jgi:hypothetical protein
MFDHGALWGLLTIVGPVLLAGALIYGMVSYRRRSQSQKNYIDVATKRLYREGERQERQES